LKERECDEKSKKPEHSKGFEAKVCFTSHSECPDGYLVDNGNPLGPHGDLEYGWGRDMT